MRQYRLDSQDLTIHWDIRRPLRVFHTVQAYLCLHALEECFSYHRCLLDDVTHRKHYSLPGPLARCYIVSSFYSGPGSVASVSVTPCLPVGEARAPEQVRDESGGHLRRALMTVELVGGLESVACGYIYAVLWTVCSIHVNAL